MTIISIPRSSARFALLLFPCMISGRPHRPRLQHVDAGPLTVGAWFPVDTGGQAAPSVVLTTDGITAYVAVEQALTRYWAEHPEQAKTAAATSAHNHPITNLGHDGGFSIAVSRQIFDYSPLIQQDTALGTLFTKYHFAPAQFAPTQETVYDAIMAVITKQVVDSTTVQGKNMALVQKERNALSTEWEQMKDAYKTGNVFNGTPILQMQPRETN